MFYQKGHFAQASSVSRYVPLVGLKMERRRSNIENRPDSVTKEKEVGVDIGRRGEPALWEAASESRGRVRVDVGD